MQEYACLNHMQALSCLSRAAGYCGRAMVPGYDRSRLCPFADLAVRGYGCSGWFFADMVLCGYGSLRIWFLADMVHGGYGSWRICRPGSTIPQPSCSLRERLPDEALHHPRIPVCAHGAYCDSGEG